MKKVSREQTYFIFLPNAIVQCPVQPQSGMRKNAKAKDIQLPGDRRTHTEYIVRALGKRSSGNFIQK